MVKTPQDKLLDAALLHVAFDGWSPACFDAACEGVGMTAADAKSIAPRGALDLAVAYHRRGDAVMVERLAEAKLDDLRFRDRVILALRYRVEAMDDREAVRRASTLFAMPTHAAEGATLVWETADKIWVALGDKSQDGNWYSKRAILAGVWASTVLFWLGDDSEGSQGTIDFVERRIGNVMEFEKFKSALRKNPMTKPLMDIQASFFGRMKAPQAREMSGFPGQWRRSN